MPIKVYLMAILDIKYTLIDIVVFDYIPFPTFVIIYILLLKLMTKWRCCKVAHTYS